MIPFFLHNSEPLVLSSPFSTVNSFNVGISKRILDIIFVDAKTVGDSLVIRPIVFGLAGLSWFPEKCHSGADV